GSSRSAASPPSRVRPSTRTPSSAAPRSDSVFRRPTTCCRKPESAYRNSASLAERARDAAHAIWRAALAAADVLPLIDRALDRLPIDLRQSSARLLVFGCGKAGASMAAAVERALGARIAHGLVAVKDGYTAPTERIVLKEASHPAPDPPGPTAAAQPVRPHPP